MHTGNNKISGLTLIEKVIDFVLLTPNPSDWTFEKQNNNPPRLIRLHQIDFLSNLFFSSNEFSDNVKSNVKSIISGEFIMKRQIDIYRNTLLKMDEVIKKKYPGDKRNIWTIDEIQYNYFRLFEYKLELTKLKKFNSGIIEISYPYLYSVTVANKISEKINSKSIDLFLGEIINPENKIYQKDKLNEKNKVLNVDLDEVDFEWM